MRGRNGLWIVLGCVLLCFPAKGSAQTPRPAAVVNGEAIPMADVEAILRNQDPNNPPIDEAQKKQIQRDAVALLIDDLLVDQYLRRYAPKVDTTLVSQRMQAMEEGLKKQGKTLADFCRESGMTEAQLRSNQAKLLQWVSFVRSRTQEADLRRYYEQNREMFDRVLVRASHIVLRVPPGSTDAERNAAVGQLTALRQQIVGGKIDFAEAARKYSQCPSASEGGDLGHFPRRFMVEEPIAQAAFAMKVGEVSNVVPSSFGVHLLKVTDRKAGQPSDFDKVKDSVFEMYMEDVRQQVLAAQGKVANIQMYIE